MSDVRTLLARCRDLGAELTPTPHGMLKLKAPAPLPEDLREELRKRKAEVLALLAPQPAPWTCSGCGRRGPLTGKPYPAPPEEPSAYRREYEQMTRALPVDFHLIDSWLVEAHPALWRQIREIDDELVRLE